MKRLWYEKVSWMAVAWAVGAMAMQDYQAGRVDTWGGVLTHLAKVGVFVAAAVWILILARAFGVWLAGEGD